MSSIYLFEELQVLARLARDLDHAEAAYFIEIAIGALKEFRARGSPS